MLILVSVMLVNRQVRKLVHPEDASETRNVYPYESADAAVVAPVGKSELRVAFEALRGVLVRNEQLLQLVLRGSFRVLREHHARVTHSLTASA